MLKLSPRLAKIASYIPIGQRVADIGTDHAYLPIYLAMRGDCPKIIASEVNPGPFTRAQHQVNSYGVNQRVELRMGDGLRVLQPGEVDIVVISGMGGGLMVELLRQSIPVTKKIGRLILQPNTGASNLRFWLVDHGFRIMDEALVEEEGRIYEIIVAEPGAEAAPDPLRIEFGPRLLEKKPPLLYDHLCNTLEGLLDIAQEIQKSRQEIALNKLALLRKKINFLREVVACLSSAKPSSR